jgi:hypothetical protein
MHGKTRRLTLVMLPLAVVALMGVVAGGVTAAGGSRGKAGGAVSFRKVVVDREFRSEGIAVADVNRDGRRDLLAGSLWYEAPRWKPREIAPVQKLDAERGYSNSFLNFAGDVNADGWADQIVIGFPGAPAVWRENPKGGSGHWREHRIWRNACNESPAFADLLGNGQRTLVFGFDDRFMAWFEPDRDATREFICRRISAANAPGVKRFDHGLGVGDMNGDGRADVVCTRGYYEAPVDRRAGPWKFVPADLGEPCAQMIVYDVNADGLPDVLTSSAHAIGVWWHEQRRRSGGPEFVRHTIDDSFSQSHALAMADINGDGLRDLVTGKRFWAHGPTGDVQADRPAVLYWYELQRQPRGVRWTRHEIDNDSGVGCQFVVEEINGDRKPDIAVSNKKGVFYFEQR